MFPMEQNTRVIFQDGAGRHTEVLRPEQPQDFAAAAAAPGSESFEFLTYSEDNSEKDTWEMDRIYVHKR